MSEFNKVAKLYTDGSDRPPRKAVIWKIGTKPTNVFEQKLSNTWNNESRRLQNDMHDSGGMIPRYPNYLILFEDGRVVAIADLPEEIMVKKPRKAKHFSITPTKRQRIYSPIYKVPELALLRNSTRQNTL